MIQKTAILATTTSVMALAGPALAITVTDWSTAPVVPYVAGPPTNATMVQSDLNATNNVFETDFWNFTGIPQGTFEFTFQHFAFSDLIDLTFRVHDYQNSNFLGEFTTNTSNQTATYGGLTPLGGNIGIEVGGVCKTTGCSYEGYKITLDAVAAVPLPASVPLLAAGLGALAGLRRKQKKRG